MALQENQPRGTRTSDETFLHTETDHHHHYHYYHHHHRTTDNRRCDSWSFNACQRLLAFSLSLPILSASKSSERRETVRNRIFPTAKLRRGISVYFLRQCFNKHPAVVKYHNAISDTSANISISRLAFRLWNELEPTRYRTIVSAVEALQQEDSPIFHCDAFHPYRFGDRTTNLQFRLIFPRSCQSLARSARANIDAERKETERNRTRRNETERNGTKQSGDIALVTTVTFPNYIRLATSDCGCCH